MGTQITIVLFPNVTQLDFTGPAQVFASMPDTTVSFVAKNPEPVMTDSGFAVVPTATIASAPPTDVLFVPGGPGTFEAILDYDLLAFVAERAASARWITSVCTGSFLLGAAGLLEGRRATSHWASLPMLDRLGAIPVRERVVVDGDLITGAGITSGIDFALTLAAEILDEEAAQRIELQLEYDPDPPFRTGSPDRAPEDWVAGGRDWARNARLAAVEEAAERLRNDPRSVETGRMP